MYTTIWSVWLPTQLDSFYTLRLDSHAQSEIRELAQAMKEVTPSKYLNLVVKV
jgi:thymidylate synthase (FAD)